MTKRQLSFFAVTGLVLVAAGVGIYVASPSFATNAEAPAAAAPKADNKKTLAGMLDDSKVYATVNGEKIVGKDVRAYVQMLPEQLQQADGSQLLPVLVNQMVNDRLVSAAAAKDGLANDPTVKARVASAQEQIVREQYVVKKLEGKLTEEAIQKKFEEMLFNTGRQEEMRASHILVKTEAEAKDIIAKLEKGEDFAKLAKASSLDPSKDNGGDLGYFTKAMMVKEFADAADALKVGEYTKTPVKTQFGYHVIKLADKRLQPKPELAQVRDRVAATLRDEEVAKLVEALRKDAKIELNVPKIGEKADAKN